MGNEVDIVSALVGQFGAIGFLIWMGYRLTHHTLPEIVRKFGDDSERQRSDFKETLQSQQEFFRREMEREREIQATNVNRIVEQLERINQSERCVNWRPRTVSGAD